MVKGRTITHKAKLQYTTSNRAHKTKQNQTKTKQTKKEKRTKQKYTKTHTA